MVTCSTQCGNFQDFRHLDFAQNQFRESRSSKIAIFSNLRGFKFCKFGKFQPTKNAKIHKNQNTKPLNVIKWQNPQN